MIKLLILVTRKAGLSRQEFIDYYETRHAPLAGRILPGVTGYRRNFVSELIHSGTEAPPLDFDAVTELVFATQADYDAFRAPANLDILKQVMDDEKHFLDSSKTRAFIVDERG